MTAPKLPELLASLPVPVGPSMPINQNDEEYDMTNNAEHVRVLEEFLSEGGLYLANERAAFTAAIAALNGREWQPIESAPHEKWVLVYWPERCENCPANPCGMSAAILHCGTWVSGRLQYGQDVQLRHQPTHWMPLPQPPKESEE